MADIAHDTACVNQDFYVWNNSTTDFGDSIINLFWSQSDSVFSNSDSVLLNLSNESLALTLEIETESGCKSDISKTININETPEIDFTFSPNYGTAPQTIEFQNLSEGLVSYVWDFGDGSIEVFEESPVHVYQENGEYTIQFRGFNEVGCGGVLQKVIPIIPSELDIEVRSVSLQQEVLSDGNIKITPSVVLFNNGTRIIENADLYMQLDGQPNVVETWTGNLNIGNSTNYTFSSFYVLSEVFDAQRICIEAKNVNDNTETNLSNNKACSLIKGLFSISNPYPNPVSHTLNLDIVTDDQGEADMAIYGLNGKILWQHNNALLNKGFNKITVDTRDFMSGKYFFKITYLNDDYLISFIVIRE